MQVTITDPCPRCGKNTTAKLSLDEAVAYDERRNRSIQAADAAVTAVKDALGPESPPIIIAIRLEDSDVYTVATLDNICSGPRGCGAKVEKLIREIFRPTPTPPKSSKTPVTCPEDETEYKEYADSTESA